MARTQPLALIFFLLTALAGKVFAIEDADLLPQEQAYRLSVRVDNEQRPVLVWDIASGYYLYQNKFKFISMTPGIAVGEAHFPPAGKKHDEFFGEMDIYRDHIEIPLSLRRDDPSIRKLELEVRSQGCADAGICYPPHKQTVVFELPESATAAATRPNPADLLAKLTQTFKTPGLGASNDDLLPPDQAFHFIAEVKDGKTLRVSWQVADGYYLYRDRFSFLILGKDAAQLGAPDLPKGKIKQEEDGAREVFYREVGFDLPVRRTATGRLAVDLQARYQGCAEKGVCYPPIEKTVRLELPPIGPEQTIASASQPGAELAESDRIAAALKTDSTWLVVASFLGFGLLMAFSPCIFPMIPILSGIIVGHGHAISTARAFLLSLSYVLAASLAYTVFGVLAGLFGGNLQAAFQAPAIIGAFCVLFVALALSMFGFYELQMPNFIQERVAILSRKQQGGTLLGAAIMGALSAIIVGPCMAAPLAGALIYIGQTGDAVLGGLALFALGMGMGIPLLIIGTSAGKLLPKAGAWMNAVKSIFGVGMLAVAVGLLERIVPAPVTMLLWALLLIIPAVYMGALEALPPASSGWRKLWKGFGVVMMAYGILMLIGVAANGDDPRQPLRGLALAGGTSGSAEADFRRVRSGEELDVQLNSAREAGHWVMLDYYADWCVSCREMERYTFADPRVRAKLANVILLQVDVTENTVADKALLSRFGLVGPPATLFFSPDGGEKREFRVVGYLEADQFLAHLEKVIF